MEKVRGNKCKLTQRDIQKVKCKQTQRDMEKVRGNKCKQRHGEGQGEQV